MIENYDGAEVTSISFSREVPQPPAERRGRQRYMSVLRAAKLTRHHREELCLVRNISAGGLMAHVYSPLDPGEPIAVELKTGHALTGSVVWFTELMIGVQFTAEIDVLHHLADIQEEQADRPARRLPRLQIQGQARMRTGLTHQRVQYYDISQGGMKIRMPDGAAVDDQVVIVIDGLDTLHGEIRWRQGEYGEVAFMHPLAFETLAQWAATRDPVA